LKFSKTSFFPSFIMKALIYFEVGFLFKKG